MGRAVYGYGAALSFHDRFGKRESQADTLCIQGFTTPVEAFENMMDIFRKDAVSVIGDPDSDSGGSLVPFDADDAAGACVIQCIFNKIADRLHCPGGIA